MNEKERMIELTKEAYKIYHIVYTTELLTTLTTDEINFTFSKYFFYMKMLTTIYPELNREELVLKWNKEIEND